MTKQKWCSCTLLLLLLFVAVPASAATQKNPDSRQDNSDKKAPLKVTSDRMVSDKQKQLITFYGSVKAVKGKLTVFSNEMVVHTTEDQSDFTSIVAVGSVRILRGDKVATGEKAVYLADKKLIKISGSPTLTEGKNRATGDKVIYYFDTEDMEIFGSKKNRSTLVIFPNEKNKKESSEENPAPERTGASFGAGVEPAPEPEPAVEAVPAPVTEPEPVVEAVPAPEMEPAVEAASEQTAIVDGTENVEPLPVTEPDSAIAEPDDEINESKQPAPDESYETADKNSAQEKSTQKPITWYTVQLGAYEGQREASRMLIRLKKAGYRAYLAPIRIDGKTIFRVRVGKYSKHEYAQIIANDLLGQEELTGVILPYSLSE